MEEYDFVVTPKSPSRKSHVRQFSRNWAGRGYLVASTRYMWLLQGLHSCYVVYVPLFFAEIALRGSYRTDFAKVWPRHKNPETRIKTTCPKKNWPHVLFLGLGLGIGGLGLRIA